MKPLQASAENVTALLIRSAVYLLLVSALALVPLLDLDRPNPLHANQLFTEISMVESGQLGLLGLGILLAASIAARSEARVLGAMLAAALSLALVRELDYFLDNYVFDGAWKTLAAAVVAAFTAYLWPRRAQISNAIGSMAGHRSFGPMLAGAAIVLGFSRLFGREAFWQTLMGDAYNRSIKNMAEESIELLGYGIIVVGLLECWLAFGRPARSAPTQQDIDS